MENEPQDPLPDLSVDDAGAALGFSTTLSDTMLQPVLDAEQMEVQDDANPTGEEEVPEGDEMTEEMPEETEEVEEKPDLEDFKTEIREELKSLKEELLEAIKEKDE